MKHSVLMRRAAAAMIGGILFLAAPATAHAQTITVNKTPWCGCCMKWVEHLRENGFEVEIKETENLTPVRQALGVPLELTSCHTGEVEGYAIEGHVPADEIHRLLKERPDATGISVPGMPAGSPGMEMGDRKDQYDVVIFSDESDAIYATYVGSDKVDLAAAD